MDYLNLIIDNYNIPLLSSFILGIMTSISPCPLATNITAIAYISKDIKTPKHTLISGLIYTLGRSISYTLLATLIYFGSSTFQIAKVFQGWGDKILGVVLIFISLVMFGVIKINFNLPEERKMRMKTWLAAKSYAGTFFLGVLFALAFCPYSGVLFFGILIPLVLKSTTGLLLPPLFALGTSLPVIVFSLILAFNIDKISRLFKTTSKLEKVMRRGVAIIFLLTGIYYLQYLVKYIVNLIIAHS